MRTGTSGGAWMVAAYAAFVGGLAAAVLAVPEPSDQELRAVIRLTAFTSVVPFLLAFTASALVRLRPSAASRWLVANRRYLGLSFAASHLGHGIAIVALVRSAPSFLPQVQTATLVGGGLGYAFVALMAATSNDAAQRTLGRAWGILHTTGLYYLWFIFIFTYLGPATRSLFHAAMVLALGMGLALRLAGRRRPARA